MLTVSQLTAILASAHDRPDADVRHWLGNMRRDGHLLVGDRPRGRGRPVMADPGEVILTAVAYELSAHDLPPKTVGRLFAAMPDDVVPAIARVVLGRHDGRCLLAVDGSPTVCAASDIVRWAEGRGSSRSALVVNLAMVVDDLKYAADDRRDAVPAGFDADLALWADAILRSHRNA